MEKKDILIVDDEMEKEKSWKHDLEAVSVITENFNVSCVKPDEFRKLLKELEQRRMSVRDGKTRIEPNSLDTTDILIVDYDLLRFDTASYITGEGFAYLARCYSECGLIITLNQFGGNRFDLTLKGNLNSFADLNISSEQINNIGLWSSERQTFRPWSWEILPNACERYRQTVDELMQAEDGVPNLDKKIMEHLKISPDVAAYLPPAVKTFISPDKEVSEVTFKEFVRESGNGLRRKDEVLNDMQEARIAAARIHKWLERRLLAGQDFLVDAPHLISRFPSLIAAEDKNNVNSWNATTCLENFSECGISHEIIAEYEFARRNWISRPAWFWKSVRECEKIDEVGDPWGTSTDYPDYVFAEDLSRFIERSVAKEFQADLPSSFVQRYVVDTTTDFAKVFDENLENINYEPQLRFAL